MFGSILEYTFVAYIINLRNKDKRRALPEREWSTGSKVRACMAMFRVTSPSDISMPTRGLLVVIYKQKQSFQVGVLARLPI